MTEIAHDMKGVFIFSGVSILLLASCSSREEWFTKKLPGTWTTDRGADVWSISADGSFDHKWSDKTRGLDYSGIWRVNGGDFVFTITNKTATNLNLEDMAPVGSITRLHLVRVDDSRLIFETGGITNRWTRKP